MKVIVFFLCSVIATASAVAQNPSAKDKKVEEKKNSFDATDVALRGSKLSAEQALELEKKLENGNDDVAVMTELLGFYSLKVYSNDNIRKKRQDMIFKLIRNCPSAAVLDMPYGQLQRNFGDTATAEKLWDEQVKNNPKNLAILSNAASGMLLINPSLAEQYLKSAKTLDPDNPKWSEKLGYLYMLHAQKAPQKALKEYEEAYSKSDTASADAMLQYLAASAFSAGDYRKSEEYSRKMLSGTDSGKENWNTGNKIFYGNFYLGRIAIKQGNVAAAEKYLLEAGKTPGSPQLDSFGPDFTLAAEVFKAGKKDTVVQFLEDVSKFWEKDKCLILIKKIKNGGKPFSEPVESNRFFR